MPARMTPERFWAKTAPEGACRVWTGYRNKQGYGIVGWHRKIMGAHRLAFYYRMGRWPEGILRHLCNNPPCVLHAVEGTYSENQYDRVAAGTHASANRTHCPAGHPYDEANTRVYNGRRHCRACDRARNPGRIRNRRRAST